MTASPRVPMLAVGAIVLDRGQLLVVKRDQEPGKGQWSLPGGRVEWGESLREAVAREVKEETDVDIDVEALAGIAERILPDDDGAIIWHVVICDFWAKPRTTDVRAAGDVSEARWIPVADLAELPLTAGLYEFLQDRGALEGRRPRVRPDEPVEPHTLPRA